MSDLQDPSLYLNREFSWLEFNFRVLAEADEADNPLLERMKFIAIVSSNLEEFYMVRVAILKKQMHLNYPGNTMDKLTPAEQLSGIREKVDRLLSYQYKLFYEHIIPELKNEGIELLFSEKEIKPYENYLGALFEERLEPVLTPISVGPTHPFPNLVTGSIYLAVELSPKEGRDPQIEESNLSFLQVPTNVMGRFVRIKDEDKFVPVEQILKLFVDRIYKGYEIQSAGVVRISRDFDFNIDKDLASDLLTEIESKIKRLHQRNIVKIEYEKGLSEAVLKSLIEVGEVDDDCIFEFDGILNFKDLFGIFGALDRNELKDEPISHIYPEEMKDKNLFEFISKKDVSLYHPYHSYDPVVDLLKQACEDEDVLAIKQTLYRTASDSRIIQYLIRAAENGKYVTVVDELRARFDEKRNIEMARKLEDAGAHVIYGVAGLKTHAKALLIVRKERLGIKRYVHMATGNYNESTAKLYTDFSYFTSDERIGEDVSSLFNLLTGFSIPVGWGSVAVAPLNLRQKTISLIRREAENAKNGIKAEIVAKMNSLLDGGIVEELYKASIAGVKIELIVRGICSLKPGIKNVSKNIRVRSIIGRYLEHPRVYYFHNGGKSEYYMASADWMTRNLDRRVELLFPIKSAEECAFVQKILDIQLKDNVNAWKLQSDGSYEQISGRGRHESFGEIYDLISSLNEKQKETRQVITPLTSPEEA